LSHYYYYYYYYYCENLFRNYIFYIRAVFQIQLPCFCSYRSFILRQCSIRTKCYVPRGSGSLRMTLIPTAKNKCFNGGHVFIPYSTNQYREKKPPISPLFITTHYFRPKSVPPVFLVRASTMLLLVTVGDYKIQRCIVCSYQFT